MLRLRQGRALLPLAVLLVLGGCAPPTPAERRADDLAYWTSVGDKFPNVEADLVSTESSYDQHEMGWISGDINTGLGEASTAREIATQAPWSDVEQNLTAAADALTNTLNDFEAGVQNIDPAAMTKAYNDYVIYERDAIAATKEARAHYVRDGGKASQILDFFGLGSGDESNASALRYYANLLRKKAQTQK